MTGGATLGLHASLALGDFRLTVARDFALSGITALFGASGSGKTTLLRTVAGLAPRARGRVTFGDEVWQNDATGAFLAPHQRGVGYVFQDARLFPHLSVAGNLRFAERRAPAGNGGIRFDDVVAALELGPLLGRRVDVLSGGERQRIAIARTLLTRPRLLLMDEPLAALDVRRKAEILPHIERVAALFGIPVVYVTHSVEEVVRLAGRMIVMADGDVVAEGPVAEIYERLDLQPLTGRFEAGVVLAARVRDHDRAYTLTRLDVAGQDLVMPMIDLPAGSEVHVRIRARDVALATRRPGDISIRNILAGRIAEIVEEPDTAYAEVLVVLDGSKAGEGHLRARVTRRSVADLGLVPGSPVFALVKSVSFDRRILPPGHAVPDANPPHRP